MPTTPLDADDQWFGDMMILQVLADSDQVNDQEREVLTRWMAASQRPSAAALASQQAPADVPADDWKMPDAPDLYRFINDTPLVASLLYDINLLPEQIDNPRHWNYMVAVCAHMEDALAASPLPPQKSQGDLDTVHLGQPSGEAATTRKD